MEKTIVFVSSMATDPWGGSEELWARTATQLTRKGIGVAVNVQHWSRPHRVILDMFDQGVDVTFRQSHQSVLRRGWRKLTHRGVSVARDELDNFVTSRKPDLIVLSHGAPLPPLEYVELCAEKSWRFVTIGHVNWHNWWPTDSQAERYRNSVVRAKRCYFVCDANRRLAEVQLGFEFKNAEIIRNPFNVSIDAKPKWPSKEGLRMACVGRLHPPTKGQDILIEALADDRWRQRDWFLTLYGAGPMRNTLERLVHRLHLTDRVAFAGHVNNVEEIWTKNHLLVLPSRAEGLPLALVEAMLCGRPAVATDVAGHPEIIEHGSTGFLAQAPTVNALGLALDHVWKNRYELREKGALAARRIRELVPADPVEVFSEKIMTIADMD